MRLSSELIANYLNELFTFTILGELSSTLYYERPLFYYDNIELMDHKIYFCKASDTLPVYAYPANNLLFLAAPPDKRYLKYCETAFFFPEDCPVPLLFNALTRLFDKYETWDQTLSDLLARQSNLSNFINCSQDIFQNPIMIHNKDFEFIAYSSVIDQVSSLSFLVDKERSVEAYNDFRLNHEFQKTFSYREPQFFPGDITGIRSLYVNIFNHSSFIGRIVVAEVNREFQNSDKELLYHFSHYIQNAIVNRTDTALPENLITLNHLVYQILSGEIREDSFIKASMNTFHWMEYHEYFCTVFLANPTDSQNQTTKMICNRLENLVSGCCVVELNHEIVMVTNLTLSGTQLQDVVASYTELVRDSFLKAGYSNVYRGFHFSFQLLYKQAQISLSYGTRYLPEIWIHSFPDISQMYQLEKLINDLPAEMVCVPEIVAMYHYDQEHQTDYLATLRVYLEHNMQAVSSARALFIHRSSLIYRLEKMQDLFSLDLQNPQSRIFLQLSILLLEQTYLNGERQD